MRGASEGFRAKVAVEGPPKVGSRVDHMRMSAQISRRTFNLSLLALLTAGFLLRYAGFVRCQGYNGAGILDQVKAYRVALGFLAGESQAFYLAQPNFPRAGTGHLPGPLMAMFWAIPLRLGGGPEAVILMLIALDTMVIGIVGVLARRMLGNVSGLWAAGFYAVAPWAVYYSIGCGNQQFLGPLAALLCLALWSVMTRPSSRQIFWVCLLLAMMPQFHVFGLFLVPSVLVLLSFRRRELNTRWLGFALLACLVLYAPYVVGEATHHWSNTRRLFSPSETDAACLNVFTQPVVALSNLFNSPTSDEYPAFTFRTSTDHVRALFADYRAFGHAAFGSFAVLAVFNLLSLGLGTLFIINLAVQCGQALAGKWTQPRLAFEKSPAIVFTGVMIFLPLLLFLLTGHQFRSRYVIALMPLLSLLPAMWLARPFGLERWSNTIHGCLVATIVFDIVLSIGFFWYRQRLITNGPYFVPTFRKLEKVRQELIAFAGPNRRLVVDASSIPTSAPHTAEYRQAHRIQALVDYVEIRDHYQHRAPATAPVIRFTAQCVTNTVGASELVVFAENGIILTVPRPVGEEASASIATSRY